MAVLPKLSSTGRQIPGGIATGSPLLEGVAARQEAYVLTYSDAHPEFGAPHRAAALLTEGNLIYHIYPVRYPIPSLSEASTRRDMRGGGGSRRGGGAFKRA